jgi:hypothetical protein
MTTPEPTLTFDVTVRRVACDREEDADHGQSLRFVRLMWAVALQHPDRVVPDEKAQTFARLAYGSIQGFPWKWTQAKPPGFERVSGGYRVLDAAANWLLEHEACGRGTTSPMES